MPCNFQLLHHYVYFDIVNGGYGSWSLNTTCNVTCGGGFETWIRECNKPEPNYGGRNCSHLGESVEFRPCFKKPCVGKYTIVKRCCPFLIRADRIVIRSW